MTITLFSKYPLMIMQLVSVTTERFGWREREADSDESRVFEFTVEDGREARIEVWQSGNFVEASTNGYIGEYLERLFCTPDDGCLEFCEAMHLALSLEDA